MNLCSYGHEEVCYECRKCPMCEKQTEVNELTLQMSETNSELDKVRAELSELQTATSGTI